ncbi:arylcarboxylate reductase [Streptomyces glomeratus]|uniref:Phenazine antibiotic biosynthesis protein n=1 Tax=Streptomyces glomeratus TaxID=284452 RepID=A0ABP6LUR6_9ACTN|nr:arylcarboxylate reductase [Streptomyces glomeratus]MCF1510913.1 arylcarboxylate reductase [Streptomyces glomeratus]
MTDPMALIRQWLQTDLDEWTRHVVTRHFDPDKGSPYWLKRAAGLDFDPRRITRYEQLSRFGPFDLEELRHMDPADLVPLSEPRPLAGRVFDSGGTTGDPCRVIYTPRMTLQRAAWRAWSFQTEGFERGRNWLQLTPTGPHLIGNGVSELTDLFGARVFLIDADPRWVKRLIRQGRLAEAEEYTGHIVEQAANILREQEIDYVNTTPALLQALVRRAPDLAAGLKGVRISGTQITTPMYRSFVRLLDGGIVGHSYGNTFGSSAGLPVERDGAVIPYVPNYPHVTIAVTDKQDWQRVVGYGELGRVRLTVLHEDLFLPNILERDQALRYDTGPGWPCDGVANVQPLQVNRQSPEGIY